jgi:L-fuculose-phosphate aldolase
MYISTVPEHFQARLVQYYQWLRNHGLNDSHSGNASIKIDEEVWITPTNACGDNLIKEQLVKCTIGKLPTKGASSDSPLHLKVYEKNPHAKAILHAHGAYSVAITMDGEDFYPIDFEGQYYFGEKITVLNVSYREQFTTAHELASDILAEKPIVIVRGHGVYAQAESLQMAYKWLCSLELSAKTSFLARQIGFKGDPSLL